MYIGTKQNTLGVKSVRPIKNSIAVTYNYYVIIVFILVTIYVHTIIITWYQKCRVQGRVTSRATMATSLCKPLEPLTTPGTGENSKNSFHGFWRVLSQTSSKDWYYVVTC